LAAGHFLIEKLKVGKLKLSFVLERKMVKIDFFCPAGSDSDLLWGML
jgi:hypothetical protein